jgi:hypothetical protein
VTFIKIKENDVLRSAGINVIYSKPRGPGLGWNCQVLGLGSGAVFEREDRGAILHAEFHVDNVREVASGGLTKREAMKERNKIRMNNKMEQKNSTSFVRASILTLVKRM